MQIFSPIRNWAAALASLSLVSGVAGVVLLMYPRPGITLIVLAIFLGLAAWLVHHRHFGED